MEWLNIGAYLTLLTGLGTVRKRRHWHIDRDAMSEYA